MLNPPSFGRRATVSAVLSVLIAAGAAAVVGLAACAPGEPPVDEAQPLSVEEVAAQDVTPSPEIDAVPLRAHAYECDDGTWMVAEYRAEDLALFLSQGTFFLPRLPVGSGAKYGDGEIVFWNEGRRALLGTAGEDGEMVECEENRRRSAIESARLDGAELWAAGNEPGWTLHVFADRMVLRTDYGERRIELPTPAVEEHGGEAVYRTTNGDVDLVVGVTGGGCSDDMSGERYPLAVRMELDGTTLRGCGQALR